jgi:hypothetical protein
MENFIHFSKIHFNSKRVNTSNVIYWGNCKYFKKHVGKKTFLSKSQNVKKRPICG